MTVARVSQVAPRVVSNGTPVARVSQLSMRVVSANTVRAQVSQLSARVVSTNVADDPIGGAIRSVSVFIGL